MPPSHNGTLTETASPLCLSNRPSFTPPHHTSPSQELDLKTYAKLVCTLLDIPVYDNPIESLHVLFTLYLEFKNNPIFRQHMEMENRLDGMGSGMGMGGRARGGMGQEEGMGGGGAVRGL